MKPNNKHQCLCCQVFELAYFHHKIASWPYIDEGAAYLKHLYFHCKRRRCFASDLLSRYKMTLTPLILMASRRASLWGWCQHALALYLLIHWIGIFRDDNQRCSIAMALFRLFKRFTISIEHLPAIILGHANKICSTNTQRVIIHQIFMLSINLTGRFVLLRYFSSRHNLHFEALLWCILSAGHEISIVSFSKILLAYRFYQIISVAIICLIKAWSS